LAFAAWYCHPYSSSDHCYPSEESARKKIDRLVAEGWVTRRFEPAFEGDNKKEPKTLTKDKGFESEQFSRLNPSPPANVMGLKRSDGKESAEADDEPKAKKLVVPTMLPPSIATSHSFGIVTTGGVVTLPGSFV
jgi:hypothetical protein